MGAEGREVRILSPRFTGAYSSIGQSNGLLIRRLQVRLLLGVYYTVVDVASGVERLTVDQEAVGSIPIIHLLTCVRSSMDRAIAFGAISWGFESLRTRAPLAQLAEHLTLNQRVEGSIPSRRIGSDVRTGAYKFNCLYRDGLWGSDKGRVLEFGRQDRLRIYWGYAS